LPLINSFTVWAAVEVVEEVEDGSSTADMADLLLM